MTDSITIFCKNNRVSLEVPIVSTLTSIYDLLGAPLQHRPMNAQVNNKTESLTYACWQPKEIEYIDYTRDSGQRTYVRSLCHLFSKAVHDLLPDASLHLEHPVSKGYYCTIEHAQPIRPALIEQIKQRMQDLIDADLPFQLHRVRTPEAIALFQKNGMPDKVKLIESAGMLYTSYYELDGYINYFYGCLTPSTGYLHLFDLQPYADGILLRVPQRNNPAELAPMIRQDKMFHAYSEHLVLQHALNLNNVGDLNEAIKHGHANEVIQVSEAMQEKQVTIGSKTFTLPKPFLVMATQNPIEQEGTYPLPEAQMDRFMMKVVVDYPTIDEERRIVRENLAGALPEVKPVATTEEIMTARKVVREVYIDEKIERYVTDIVFATRYPDRYGLGELKDFIAFGGSPRASICLAKAARAYAFVKRRGYVVPEDIRSVAHDVLRHRIGLTYEAEASNISVEELVSRVINKVEVP